MSNSQGGGRGHRLVLFSSPFQGHISPMLQLATILHSKGFSITIIHTQFNSPNISNYPNFTFLPISDGLSESQVSTEDFIARLSILNINCILPFRDCLARLLSDNPEDPVACLICDAPMHFTQAVADSLKLPRIVLWTTSVISFLVHNSMVNLWQKGCLPIQASQLESPLPEFPFLKVMDLPVINSSDQENVHKFMAAMTSETKASSGLILNSFEDLEQSALAMLRQEFPIPIFPIGPFHKYYPAASTSSLITQDRSCIAWLDAQEPRSVIYVSFGSVVAIDEFEFVEISLGLANSRQPFLWVVRPGSIRGLEWIEQLPNGFLEMISGKGCIVKWAPQKEVLAHPAVGGFWTHNGWNSTLESICEGIPMFCWPSFGDQIVNAKYVSHVWKVGLQVEKGREREEIEKGIRRLMVDKEVEEIRERVMILKEKVDISLSGGGSSYESLESLIRYLSSF